MIEFSDQQIIDSWKKNVNPWVKAVREDEIESRITVTNKAIIDTILKETPKTLLDIGCGEGWLVRALEDSGISSLGIDVVPDLIIAASEIGGGRFKVLSYEQLNSEALGEKFDLIVCNFSLLGKESVVNIFRQVPYLLNTGGVFIVQTVHPLTVSCTENYKDGWREGSWAGFSNTFCDPAPWYFRTIGSWINLFLNSGFKLKEIQEPINPVTKKVASIILKAEIAY